MRCRSLVKVRGRCPLRLCDSRPHGSGSELVKLGSATQPAEVCKRSLFGQRWRSRACEENAESAMVSPQDDDEGAVESGADDDEERAPFRMIYNKFLSKYWRWVNGEVAELVGRELLRKRVSFSLWGKSYEQKKLLARAFWNEKGCKQSEQTRILEHWNRRNDPFLL